MTRYLVTSADCTGEIDGAEVETWEQALAEARRLLRARPRNVVQVFDMDKVDYNSNGLTDEQDDELAEALESVRTEEAA